MTDTLWLLLAIAAPVVTGLLTLPMPRSAMTARVVLALLGPASACGIIAGVVAQGPAPAEAVPTDVVGWVPSLYMNFSFMLDGLGTFFALLVAGIGCLIVLYARGYFGPDPDSLYRFYPTLGFFTTAMLGLVMSDYTLTTVLFWEMTSISSFLLIGWDRYDKEAVRLAMQAFFTTGLGGLGLLGGVLLLGATIDHWTWSETVLHFQYHPEQLTDPAVVGAFLLMLFGAFTKSAQVPFHYWLPGAMAAPTPVSAYLHSATMVKAGVYLIGRLMPALGSVAAVAGHAGDGGEGHSGLAGVDWWPLLIIPFGAVTMTGGAIIAINQHDLKKIFAYTTVSQLGLLMTAYGLGGLIYESHGHAMANLDLDITQIANHAFYKAPLFIIAGALGHVLSRNITELHGAFFKRPAMCITLILAGFALAGLPGSISFQAKELFLYAIVHSYQTIGTFWLILMAAAITTAACNVAIFVRLTTTVLGLPGSLGSAETATAEPDHHHAADPDEDIDESPDPHGLDHDDEEHHHEHYHDKPGSPWGWLIWLPGLIIVLPQFIGGLFPSLWMQVLGPLETNTNYFLGEHGHYDKLPSVLYAITHPGIPLMCSGIAIALGLVLGFSKAFRGVFNDPANGIYPAMYSAAVDGGRMAFQLVQTGNLRHYLVMVLMALLVGFSSAVWLDPAMLNSVAEAASKAGESWTGAVLGLIVCALAMAMPLAKERIVRVLLLGGTGMGVVSLFLVYQAPDLALTQLMVEIISVLLFVLVLRMLPRRDLRVSPHFSWRLLLAIAAGVSMGWLTLVTAGSDPTHLFHDMKLGEFFARNTYDGHELTDGRGGGGDNIVNVILVDFRGFDTFGEICVLALAALGVFTLLPGRKPKTV
ncbi:MAG: hydrogen gas-evolving membrane-bound hydrogenase subunit E [Planctomycetota bacterium]